MSLHPSIYEAFQVVMQAGTISSAAEILGRSQPAVSRMIDKLEEHVGVKLFERRKGRVVPTHAAHLLIDEVARFFVTLDSLDDFGKRMKEGRESGVTIASLPALGLEFMPEAIARFSADRPHARIVLNVRMSVSVEKWVATQQVDFGLAETPFSLSGFATRLFADTTYVAAIPASHPAADDDSLRPEHLRDERIVGWTGYVSARRIFDDIMQGAGIAPHQIVETSMSAPICAMVKRGMGIGIVDPFTAWTHRDPSIVFRPFHPKIPCRFAILSPNTRMPTDLAGELIGHAEELRDEVLSHIF